MPDIGATEDLATDTGNYPIFAPDPREPSGSTAEGRSPEDL